jgi:quercetin dioxygenase-like cupin family protein
LPPAPFTVLDWTQAQITEHAGERGVALWSTLECGSVRTRLVTYSPGYLADHWCRKGHVIYVLEGEFVSELENGEEHRITQGQGYVVGDDVMAHRSYTEGGVKLLIVD